MVAPLAIGFVTIHVMTDYLGQAFPELAQRLPKTSLADLPTPVTESVLTLGSQQRSIAIKHDDLTGQLYGGNKVRKLEYILQRARDRHAKRVATFGTVASNHALATALYASALNFGCTCFLSHQANAVKAPVALNMHLRNNTELVHYGGGRADRVQTLRKHLWNRHAWVIPMGGSSWLGAVSFVNAGLELADQVAAGDIAAPERLYVANGTMATAAGLALGLALAGLHTQVHAIRVTHEFISNRAAMQRLIAKTATFMRRFDASIPADLANMTRLCFRDEFFGDGYARSNSATDRAIEIARDQLGLALDMTYTGKAMAALLHDDADEQSGNQNQCCSEQKQLGAQRDGARELRLDSRFQLRPLHAENLASWGVGACRPSLLWG